MQQTATLVLSSFDIVPRNDVGDVLSKALDIVDIIDQVLDNERLGFKKQQKMPTLVKATTVS